VIGGSRWNQTKQPKIYCEERCVKNVLVLNMTFDF